MSAERLGQIAAVMGSCTAGGAYVPAMSDETIIVKGTGTIFLGGPPLVKAATGEDVTAEELGGADVHTQLSGVADYLADDDDHALRLCRSIMSTLNMKKSLPADYDPVRGSQATTLRDLYGIVNADLRRPYDVREVIARMVDGSRFDEFKARYGTTLVTGFARIHGLLVGIIANNGVLFSESALKATHFIELCNLSGHPARLSAEHHRLHGRAAVRARRHRQGRRENGARGRQFRGSEVHGHDGGSFGAGNYSMCGRAYEPRFLWMWPNARISVMGGETAASVLATVKRDQIAREGKTIGEPDDAGNPEPISPSTRAKVRPYYSTARLWDDGIMDPAMTRGALAQGLSVACNARSAAPIRCFRM